MTLPNRFGATYVYLGDKYAYDVGIDFRGSRIYYGHVLALTDTNFDPNEPKFRQDNFFSYAHYYKDYPSDFVIKNTYFASQPIFDQGNGVYLSSNGYVAITTKYPKDIVYDYDPTPPPGPDEPPPDPNGETGDYENNVSKSPIKPGTLYPRFVDWDAYNWSNVPKCKVGGTYNTGWIPKSGDVYYAFIQGFFGNTGFPSPEAFAWSLDLTVQNKQSEVYNVQTEENEYYDFAQTSFDFKQTAHGKVEADFEACCWNDGTNVSGKVGFASVSAECEAMGGGLSGPVKDAEYGFGGMKITIGGDYSDAGTADWSITIGEDYNSINYEIPVIEGRICFVNDFWVTTVTPPSST